MTDAEIRDEVRAWLAANWNSELGEPLPLPSGEQKSWARRVFEGGWAAVSWPADGYGRGWSADQARVVLDEFVAAGAQGRDDERTFLTAIIMTRIFASVVQQYGQAELKRTLLPRLLSCEVATCLLYSEPGAGSDLASVLTRADRTEGGWRIRGQKVWTSGAKVAEYALLLARTDWDRPKHKGLSFFLFPMRQPGVEIRPIRQITDESHFNEVFLDDAFTPSQNLLGEENDGWKILRLALLHEREGMGTGGGARRPGAAGDTPVDLIASARRYGRLSDPVLRQQIAQTIAYRKLNDLNMARGRAESAAGTASPILATGKLAMSRILHAEARALAEILGANALLDGADHPDASDANYRALHAYLTSIGGGTDQIQRNIIAEQVLNLPREIEVDRDIPFRESRAAR